MAVAGLLALAGAVTPMGAASRVFAEPPKAAAEEGPDQLIFADGTVRRGTILSETATTVKFKGSVSGLAFETEYPKTSILKIVKGAKAAEGDKPAPAKAETVPTPPPIKTPEPATEDGKQRVYQIDLEGNFGEQISQTPLRLAIEDARKNKADVLVISLNAEYRANSFEKLGDDKANFDEIFRAEKLAEIFTDDIPKNWEKQPRVVFWVKQAMAGAALLPLVCKEIYFAPDARLGGLGNLSFIFEGVGDDVVREKQRSLRLAHAEGWAIVGGYDPRLIRAMARAEYVLSYRLVNGKAELFEGMPSNGNEFLLTDDGKDSNQDTDAQRVSGEGNDVLTLKADVAQTLGVSKKTVATSDELINAMGLERTALMVPGKSKQIIKEWTTGIDSAKRQLKKLRDDYGEVRMQQPGDYDARTRFRNQRKSVLESMKRVLTGRFEESLSPRWLAQNGIPSEAAINLTIEQLKIEQLKDRK